MTKIIFNKETGKVSVTAEEQEPPPEGTMERHYYGSSINEMERESAKADGMPRSPMSQAQIDDMVERTTQSSIPRPL